MPLSPRDSIKYRLTAIMMLVSLMAIAVVSVAIFLSRWTSKTQETVGHFSSLAGVVGSSTSLALASGDYQEVSAILGALKQEKELLSASLYSRNGNLVASYRKPCLLYTSPSPRDATLSRMPSSA